MLSKTEIENPTLASRQIRWSAFKAFCGAFYTFLSRLLWILVIIVIVTILFQGLTQHTTVIEPISVPKALADSGYTPEVAGRRLRDAMMKFAADANTQMKNPDLALHGNLPNIIVPSVGISLDAVISTIRTLLHTTRTRNVAGEFTINGKLLWLHLRIGSQDLYSSQDLYISPSGVDPEDPDKLLVAAVPKIMEIVQPYFVATSLRKTDPAKAF